MRFFQNNFLIAVFVLTQLFLLLLAHFHDEILGEVDIEYASIIHCMSVLLVVLGYVATKITIFPSKVKRIDFYTNNFISISKTSTCKLYILVIIGLITSILTVAIFVSPTEYLQMLSSGDNSILMLRENSGKGGISGIFKMLNYAPLGIYLATSSFLFFLRFEPESRFRMQKIERFSLLATCIKVLFSLDRLTIMAVFVVQIYKVLFARKKKWKIYIGIFLAFIVANWVSSLRMGNDGGILGGLITYCKLSLANFQLLLNKQEVFSYIGTSTFFHPFMFIARFVDIELKEVPISDYIWNSAQYFNSYLYLDFGYCSLFIQFLIGCFISRIESKRKSFNISYIGGYFFYIFVIISFISVPFIRAIEFWFVLILIYFEAHLLKINTDDNFR